MDGGSKLKMEVIALPQRKTTSRRKKPIYVPMVGANAVRRAVIVPSVPAQQNKRKRNRVRKSKNAVEYSPKVAVSSQMQMPGVSTSGKGNRQIVISRELKASLNLNKVTPEGVKFLKCAFSAPDFDGSGTYGVPDEYCGKSIAIKHRLTTGSSFATGSDYYILLLPIPGYSYFYAQTTAGVPPGATTLWTGVIYSDFQSLYGGGNTGDEAFNVTKFRYVSQHLEIISTTNANNWSGSIQSWKLPVQVMFGDNSAFTASRRQISGLNGTAANDQDMYTGGFNLGVYTGAYNKGSTDWAFSSTWNNVFEIPNVPLLASDWGQVIAQTGYYLPGFDNNFETTCIKVSGISGTNSAILRTWACVEYQFVPGTMMYEMQNLKFTCDKRALELYRYIVMNLPAGVSAFDNANFWSRVLAIIKQVSGGLSMLPGPYGLAATGVNSLARAVEELTL